MNNQKQYCRCMFPQTCRNNHYPEVKVDKWQEQKDLILNYKQQLSHGFRWENKIKLTMDNHSFIKCMAQHLNLSWDETATLMFNRYLSNNIKYMTGDRKDYKGDCTHND